MDKQLCDDNLKYTCIHYTQFTLLFNYQKGRGRRRGEEERGGGEGKRRGEEERGGGEGGEREGRKRS